MQAVDSSVALRKESVDRNRRRPVPRDRRRQSLSARRAWIETASSVKDLNAHLVALRKESVDRNTVIRVYKKRSTVALRKESVDRNIIGCPM